MPLYDFFQQIEYIPIYISKAPDNWRDPLFYVKTFCPGLLTAACTATVAFMAYRVSRSQRTIAANKYNLDLFDKRYEIFDSMIETRDNINKFEIPYYDKDTFINAEEKKESSYDFGKKQSKNIECIRNFMLKEFKEISSKLEKASRIFHNIRKDDVKKFKEILHEFEKQKEIFFSKSLKKYSNDIEKEFEKSYSAASKFNFESNIEHQNNIISNSGKEIIKYESTECTEEMYSEIIEEQKTNIIVAKDKINTLTEEHTTCREELLSFDKEIYKLISSMEFLKNEFVRMSSTMDEYLYISETAY